MATIRSNLSRNAALAVAALFIVAAAFAAEELTPSINMNWFTIDGGGGTSSGDGFDMSGTIGQPDANLVMTGPGFEFSGGFWAGVKKSTCLGDLNGDTMVGVPDLLAVINAWGPCPSQPTPCPADIVPPLGDKMVGVPDLLAVINAWGMCPP